MIGATKTRAKVTKVATICSKCMKKEAIDCSGPGAHNIIIPKKCAHRESENCPDGSIKVMADDCSFIDEQKLKLQEAPEEVPTGEMPRSIELSVERYLVDKCPPGTRVEVMGISSLSGPGQQKGGTSTVRLPYLRVVGININTEGSGRVSRNYSPSEEEEMQ